tara:strand:- start:561 stop:878 length:318 start_codon:yes stop_codon:yes gene_type:complete
MQSQNIHPAGDYVVYGNNGPIPTPNSTEELNTRELKLQTSAKRQAITLINYEIEKNINPIIPILPFRTSPPIICSNGGYYRYSNEEWEHAVNQAKKQYILELEDK